jgi:hypothetical protein
MQYTYRYKGGKAHLKNFLRRLPRILAGTSPDTTRGGVKAVLTRMGMVALAIIREAFVVKAGGGVDASGMKWEPLKPETIAYSRRHPGLRRDTEGELRPSSMLSSDERHHWWVLYGQRKAWYKGDKSHAAASAWRVLLDAGAKTILSEYGSIKVDILRDTGRLFNSLAPGIRTTKVQIDGESVTWAASDQLFKLEPGAVTVGTNVEYASKHHHGDPDKNLPARPLWPAWENWPDAWKDQIYEAMQDGVADLVVRWLASASKT